MKQEPQQPENKELEKLANSLLKEEQRVADICAYCGASLRKKHRAYNFDRRTNQRLPEKFCGTTHALEYLIIVGSDETFEEVLNGNIVQIRNDRREGKEAFRTLVITRKSNQQPQTK